MAEEATTSEGVTVKRGDGASTETFNTIGEVFDFDGLGEAGESIEVTTFADSIKKWIGGISDGGTITLQMYYVAEDQQQQGLRADRRARTKRNFQIDFNDPGDDGVTTLVSVNALVQDLGPIKMGVNQAKTWSVTLKVNSLPTYRLAH